MSRLIDVDAQRLLNRVRAERLSPRSMQYTQPTLGAALDVAAVSLTVPSDHSAVGRIDLNVAGGEHRPGEVKVERVPARGAVMR